VSTQTLCDGCGCSIGTSKRPNYWHATFMGDTLRDHAGDLLNPTGLSSKGNRQYQMPLDKADLCIPCMSKTREENAT